MKSIATHLSSIILQGSMKKVSGSKIIILITLLLFGFSTLYSQNPRLEHRIMNLRYESTYAFPGNTGLVPPVGPFNSPALVFDLEVRAGENYKSTGWAMGTADIELRYIIEPGVTIREMALWRTTLPVPNPHTIANAFVTWYPFGFLYPNVARIHIGRYYSAGNPYANDFTEAWAKICTIAIPVLSGTPTSATCFELMVSNGLPTHSSWCSAMAPNPDDYQFFNAACPARSCLGMPDHVTFNYDYTLNLCYGDPAITLPNTSNEGVTGVWEPSNIITTDAVGSTEYKFVPDDPLWCEAIILANVLPPTEIEVEPAIWACPGIVDLTPAIIPNPDLKGTYKFYTLEGTNYIETGSLVTLAGMTAVTFYVHYTETDSCPSRYVPFQVEFITPPNIPDIYFECDNGLITDIVINVHQDDCVYSIDGITYQTGLVFGPFIPGTDPSYTVYVMDTITGCITTKFIECQTCDDIPEITVTDPGSGAICYAAGVTYAVDVEFMYADSVVVSHNGYGNLDYEVFYAPTMSFTSIYTPVAADAGNTVTLTFKIPAANTCPEVVETVDIVVNPMPSVVVNVAGKDTSVCYSANYTFNLEHLVTLGAGDELQHSFTKSFTSGTYSITPTVVIPYNTSQYVYLRAVNNTTGCPASAIDSIRLTVNPSPTVSVTVTGKDTVVCSDGPVIFDLTTMVSFTDCDSLVFSESKDFIPPVANITAFTVTPEVYDLKLYVKGVNKSTECETDEADIDSVTISVLLIAYSTDTYDICGASFTWTNGDGNVYTSSNNTATHTITGGAANGCDSIVTLNLTLRPIAYGVDTYDECGASFTWTNGDGNVYTSSNNTATHTITGGAANGCDSIVTLNLTLRPIAYGTDVHNICGATSFDWIDGNTYTSDNNTATWKIDNGAANGCDSIVTLNLTFTPYATGTDVIVLPCGQTSFDWIDGNTYTSDNNTATHTITGGSVNGCDSIVTLNLTFRHIAHSTDTYDVCGASFTWTNGNGNVYTSSNNTATHTVTGGAANGCDSIVTLNLTLRPIAYSTDTYNVCGASFTWTNGDGNVYTSSNNTATHTITGGAANGCDSIVTLNLTLRPIAYGTDTYNICGASFTWTNGDGNVYTSSNNTATHTITGGAANGCDSIVTLNLTLRPIAYGTDTYNICGASFTWTNGDGNVYTSSNNTATHTITGGAANGCDSIVTLNLTLRPIAYSTDTYNVCGASFTWTNGNGNVYTSSNNTATHTITGGAANGCDSIVTLNLTLRPIAYGTDTYNICGASFTWTNGDGNVYTSSNNTATHTITGGAANGCDSIVTLNLTLRPIAYGTDTYNVCGASFTWTNGDGNVYTSSNNTATHTITGGAANGCDSIVTLNLTLRPIAYGTDVINICGTSYQWINGVTYTSSNNTATHTITGGAANGCDSIVTLNLTIRPIAYGTDVIVLQCGQTSFQWIDGVTYTSNNNTATWTISGGAANGCDSIVTLNLTFRPFALATNINASDVTICYGQTATLTATSNLMNPVFRWYTSQTATTPIHVGATLVTGILTANTTYYVSVMGTNVCENEPGARKPVTVIVDLCKLMNCDLLTDKVVKEDGPYACKYTHSGTGWDAKTAALIPNPFDNVKYYLNGVLTNPENTLNGVEFPLGLSQVMVEAFFDILIDTCYFNVYVERVCPTVSDPDGDGNTYPVTSVGGLCWTSNLKTTTYTNGNEIAFAKPYYSSIYNDVEANTNNFGLLYTWYSALGIPEGDNTQVPANYQGICPDGWHIPTQAELDQLNVWTARDLKSTSYWIQPGTNLSGFDSRGAGKFLVAVGKCVDLYGYTGYWASDADPGLFAPYISLLYYLDNCDILMGEIDKNDGISVRCVWDGEGCE